MTVIYGAADKVSKTGDTMTGTLILDGATPVQVPAGGAAGNVLTSDASGNGSWQNPGAVSGVDWYNVKTYGATGNGTTDDTTAIQNAINAAGAKGGTVYFPAGTYKLSAALNVPNLVSLLGAGPAVTVLNQTSTTVNGITYNPTSLNYIHVQNLTIQGPGSGTGVGLYVQANSGAAQVTSCSFKNLAITGFGSDGFILDSGAGCSLASVSVTSVGGHGFYLSGGTGNTLDACTVFGNASTQIGFNLNAASYTALAGCKAYGCSGGYLITAGSANTITGCGADTIVAANGQDGSGFKVSGGTGHTLTGCYSNVNKAKAFWITGSAATITLTGVQENAPGVGATASIQVDAASTASVVDHTVVTAVSYAAGTASRLTGGYLAAAGAAGATLASRYVGGVSGAAPASGTFNAGDMVIDQGGPLWVCTAAGSPGSWAGTGTHLIATATLGAAAATVSFTGIPQNYTHLFITGMGQTTATGNTSEAALTFNGDSGTNYAQASIQNPTSGNTPIYYSTNTVSSIGWTIPMAAASTSTVMGQGWAYVMDYRASWPKTVIAMGGVLTSTVYFVGSRWGAWSGTGAVTSLTFTGVGGNFIAGTTFRLYGVL